VTEKVVGLKRPAWAGLVYDFVLLTAGAVILAVNVDLFLAPADLAPGGVSGLAIILRRLAGWPIGVTMLVLNIPMLVLGFFNLGRFHFLIRTAFVVLIYNLGVDVIAGWLPAAGITADPLLNALYGGVVGGIGTGLVYRASGTSAGTGVASRVLQMRTGIPMGQVYFITDGGVIILAGLVFGWESALYALLALFVWGLTTDYVLEGPSVVRTAFIVTDYPDRIARALFSRLGLGVTAWPAQGMFTEAQHTVLFCTINRPDVNPLKRVVRSVDPRAFVVIGHGHQSSGGVVPRSHNAMGLDDSVARIDTGADSAT
jgi:uncharacterized membrane-anchored protein YitT (DUF2179 family)